MENPSFIFSSGPVELKEEGENFFVEGYISTSDLDLVNDIVTKDCMMDMAEQMRERTIKLDVEHESFKGQTDLEVQINKTIIPAAKIEDFLMDKKGLKVRAMLNKHIQRFQEVKNSIRDGFLDAFSIAFVPVEETIQQKDGQEVRMLDKVNLLNIAFTGNPINTNASIEKVFMKSLDFLKDQEKAKPKKPKPQPDPHKEPEDEEDEEKGCGKKPKKKKVLTKEQREFMDSVIDYMEKKLKIKLTSEQKSLIHNHSKDDIIKLQEVKKMEEDNKESSEESETQEEGKEEEKKEEAESTESESTESKDEESSEESGEKEDEEKKEEADGEEIKALTKKVDVLEKELVEIKARLKAPVRKSKVEQQDKSEQFVEEKSKDPLDLIA